MLSEYMAQWANIGIVVSMLFSVWVVGGWFYRNHRLISTVSRHAAIALLVLSLGLILRIGYWVVAIAVSGDIPAIQCDPFMDNCQQVNLPYPDWAIRHRWVMWAGMLGIAVGISMLIATLNGRQCKWAYRQAALIVLVSGVLAWVSV